MARQSRRPSAGDRPAARLCGWSCARQSTSSLSMLPRPAMIAWSMRATFRPFLVPRSRLRRSWQASPRASGPRSPSRCWRSSAVRTRPTRAELRRSTRARSPWSVAKAASDERRERRAREEPSQLPGHAEVDHERWTVGVHDQPLPVPSGSFDVLASKGPAQRRERQVPQHGWVGTSTARILAPRPCASTSRRAPSTSGSSGRRTPHVERRIDTRRVSGDALLRRRAVRRCRLRSRPR